MDQHEGKRIGISLYNCLDAIILDNIELSDKQKFLEHTKWVSEAVIPAMQWLIDAIVSESRGVPLGPSSIPQTTLAVDDINHILENRPY